MYTIVLLLSFVLCLPFLTRAETPEEAFTAIEDVPDGLGPRFNAASCAQCHAHPLVGGSSPSVNPQVSLATAQGARNVIPSFIATNGPVREVRSTNDGLIHQLFVITGRTDAPAGCMIPQPDFTTELARGTLSFRIPPPLFG